MYFLQTNDVELTSIAKNKSSKEMAKKVLKVGQPRLLNLYSKHDIEATFFFTGDIVELEPEIVDITKDRGHEIACHGYDHDSSKGFDTKNLQEQVFELNKCKKIFKDNFNFVPTTFKSPELRIGLDTPKALSQTGFNIDCSVASQRFDGPFSFGSLTKLNWLKSPRKPYMMDIENPFKAGNSNILEIPISSLIFPYIGTMMRIKPRLFSMFENIILQESKITGKPAVFIFHPNECIKETKLTNNRIDKSRLGYLRETYRQNLKMSNLGINAVKLMDKTLRKAKALDFEFVSAKTYRKKVKL